MAAGGMTPADRRKLSAIYSALDSHNSKQALKLIKVFLERHSESPLGVALSAIAYEREGRVAEAGQALDKLIALKPRDVQVINTAAGALKVLGRHDDLTALWVNAAEADPSNEELQQQLFLAHGRSSNHSKQSQLAGTLYKTFKKPRYLFWMAGAAYLQWHASNGKEALQLTLAEKWAAKAAEEAAAAPAADALTPTVQLETVLFTVELQEALGKHEAALATLAKHAGLFKSEPALLLRTQSSLYTRLGKYKEARDAQVRILDSAVGTELTCKFDQAFKVGSNVLIDDWDVAVALVGQVQEPGKEKEEEEELRKLFASLTERAPEARRRGPLLASILLQVSFLERLSRQSPRPALPSAPLCQALQAYLKHVADRPCLLADLSPLLVRAVAVLPDTELASLAGALIAAGTAAPELAQLLPISVDKLPAPLHPVALSLASARRLLSQYISVPANKRHESLPLLFKAMVAASAAHSTDPIARITILLMKLYQLAGAGTLAAQQVGALSLKHVQWLSLPYLFIDENIDLVVPVQAPADAYKGVAKFIADARREMPDLATQPFRYDSFSKLREFARMREKLARSLAAPEAAIDAALLSLAETPAVGPASVLMQTVAVFAAPLPASDVATLEILSDKSVLPALSPLATEQSALLATRYSAPEAWRRAVLVSRSTVGPFLRHLSVTPSAEQLTAYKASASAALSQMEAVSATLPALAQHPLQRGARLLVQLIDISLQLLASKAEDADEAKLNALLISLPEAVGEGLALWQAPHGWWGGDRLGAARRWQLEEATWGSLALQCWLKMVPRKAKPARAALKKAHAQLMEGLGKAVDATQWVDWRAGLSGLDEAESNAAVAVEGAQKSALAALRNALIALRAALQEAKP